MFGAGAGRVPVASILWRRVLARAVPAHPTPVRDKGLDVHGSQEPLHGLPVVLSSRVPFALTAQGGSTLCGAPITTTYPQAPVDKLGRGSVPRVSLVGSARLDSLLTLWKSFGERARACPSVRRPQRPDC